MTTPREQITTGIVTALRGVVYSSADAIESAVVFSDLITKVEQHLLAAGWTPSTQRRRTNPQEDDK